MELSQTLEDLAVEETPKMPGRNGGWLKRGNPGHDGSNAGAPKSIVKKNAGLSAQDAVEEVRKAIEDHKTGKNPLPYSQLLKSVEILCKVSFGDVTEIVLGNETILAEVAEAIAGFFEANDLDPEMAMSLYDTISQRLKDR